MFKYANSLSALAFIILSSYNEWDNKYLDHQLVQKVLTRFEGEEGEIETTIEDLFRLCLSNPAEIVNSDSVLEYANFDDHNMKFPLTAKKLKSMLSNLLELQQPMVSFWTS